MLLFVSNMTKSGGTICIFTPNSRGLVPILPHPRDPRPWATLVHYDRDDDDDDNHW